MAALGIAAGNTLEAVVAAYFLRRAAGTRPRLETVRVVRALVLVSAPLGALVECAHRRRRPVRRGRDPLSRRPLDRRRLVDRRPARRHRGCAGDSGVGLPRQARRIRRGELEVTLLCVGTVIVAEVVLGHAVRLPLLGQVEYLYLLFPFVIWSALRFGPRGGTLITLLISIAAVWHTTRGSGPFVDGSTTGTLFAVACYLGALAITGLALSAAVASERDSATEALRQSDEQLKVALDAAGMGIWSWSSEDNTLTWDDALRGLYGLRPGTNSGVRRLSVAGTSRGSRVCDPHRPKRAEGVGASGLRIPDRPP